ncbi:hypothetical protein F5Y15DRAFT_419869 [Xylariaceae sp. FL0016]|nr:hypothetical protein F5Y15DRAFT_419869 [Xylariaceae sp. FL0016]
MSASSDTVGPAPGIANEASGEMDLVPANTPAASNEAASAGAFHCFPKLPPELKNMIWSFYEASLPIPRHKFDVSFRQRMGKQDRQTYPCLSRKYRVYYESSLFTVGHMTKSYEMGIIDTGSDRLDFTGRVHFQDHHSDKLKDKDTRYTMADLSRHYFHFGCLMRDQEPWGSVARWFLFTFPNIGQLRQEPENTHWVYTIQKLVLDTHSFVVIHRDVFGKMTALKSIFFVRRQMTKEEWFAIQQSAIPGTSFVEVDSGFPSLNVADLVAIGQPSRVINGQLSVSGLPSFNNVENPAGMFIFWGVCGGLGAHATNVEFKWVADYSE